MNREFKIGDFVTLDIEALAYNYALDRNRYHSMWHSRNMWIGRRYEVVEICKHEFVLSELNGSWDTKNWMLAKKDIKVKIKL
jgi:hypothetical protein